MKNLKLIGIPFAGGNKYSYKIFDQFLQAHISLKTVEFPGRGERLGEDNISDVSILALDVLRQIEEDIQTGEYIIYGHSLGALVGYELVKEIIRKKYPAPLCLVVTGRAAPSVPEEDQISSYAPELFWNEVAKHGGIPNEVLASKESVDFFEPILRSDFKAAESYTYKPITEPLKFPICAIAGTREIDISDDELRAWQNETAFPLHLERMEGDHFFIFQCAKKLLQQIHNLSTSGHKPFMGWS